MKTRIVFLYIAVLAILTSCKDATGPPIPPVGNGFPDDLEIMSPNATETYWTDQPISCVHDALSYADKTTWLVDGESMACVDGELDASLAEGEHTITARIADDGDNVEASVTITVKEGFSVTLAQPKDGAEYFVGDMVACEATVEPAQYEEYLTITANGRDCTSGEVELTQAGETTIRAVVNAYGRTEADEVTVTANAAVAGKVYPLTDQGVAGDASGFTVTLRAGGDVLDTQTDTDGNFAIKSEAISALGNEQVTLSVSGRSGDFYGSKAVLPASELLALVEADELGFILAPKSWQIRDGKLAGKSTNLKLRAAFTRVIPGDPGTSFYRLNRIYVDDAVDSEPAYMYLSVPPEYRPFQTAFNRPESSASITASDSSSFWKETDDALEPDLGRGNLYASSTLAQVPTTFDGVHVSADEPDGRSTAGVTIDSKDGSVFIAGGSIDLDIDRFGKDRTQQHEQIHVFGFGHASGWNGIMTYDVFHGPNGERYTGHPGSGTNYLTVDDVAHIQVYLDAMDLQDEQDISFGVLEWMLALNIPGLPPKDGGQKALGKHTDFPYTYEIIEYETH